MFDEKVVYARDPTEVNSSKYANDETDKKKFNPHMNEDIR